MNAFEDRKGANVTAIKIAPAEYQRLRRIEVEYNSLRSGANKNLTDLLVLRGSYAKLLAENDHLKRLCTEANTVFEGAVAAMDKTNDLEAEIERLLDVNEVLASQVAEIRRVVSFDAESDEGQVEAVNECNEPEPDPEADKGSVISFQLVTPTGVIEGSSIDDFEQAIIKMMADAAPADDLQDCDCPICNIMRSYSEGA